MNFMENGTTLSHQIHLDLLDLFSDSSLENYMSVNQDIKLKDLSKKFNVSVWTVCRWLKKIGYSYKKKPLAMWKQAKRSEINT